MTTTPERETPEQIIEDVLSVFPERVWLTHRIVARLRAAGLLGGDPTEEPAEEEIVAKVLSELEVERETADDGGWGTTFHRHGISNEIHRGIDGCSHPGRKRQVYVFDPDYLAEHDEWVVLATLRIAAGVAPQEPSAHVNPVDTSGGDAKKSQDFLYESTGPHDNGEGWEW